MLDKETALAMAHLRSQVEANGVGSLKVSDGEMFMFSEKCLENLLKTTQGSEDKMVVVFVKTGGLLEDNQA